MSSKEIFIMAIILLVSSPAWFLAEHTALAIIWLCAGVADLIVALPPPMLGNLSTNGFNQVFQFKNVLNNLENSKLTLLSNLSTS